ncbi:hypothetical protein TRFO_07142 [Tritrichomonas foetus]|uniref:3'-5' exonuclease domain-containing protein n=1 Tax=Tritrichomonas foetus TaxID=1144522 RepID=A0A1J4JXR0_9EUKA|nr:hypothetical protein TRFO_07142 [Tritrichomonas foetus]|eukprot:OHT02324.1 hypothetical protein TRFO_07142 [Tritrichomonas foetus]
MHTNLIDKVVYRFIPPPSIDHPPIQLLIDIPSSESNSNASTQKSPKNQNINFTPPGKSSGDFSPPLFVPPDLPFDDFSPPKDSFTGFTPPDQANKSRNKSQNQSQNKSQNQLQNKPQNQSQKAPIKGKKKIIRQNKNNQKPTQLLPSSDSNLSYTESITGIPEIGFNQEESIPLEKYKTKAWRMNTDKNVEFFDNEFTNVLLVNYNDENLEKLLNSYIDGNPIALDLEWKCDRGNTNNPIALYQICTSKGALLIRSPKIKPSANELDVLKNFFGSNKFIMKGMMCDRNKLKSMFGNDFQMEVEDVEATRLAAYKESKNFQAMVERYAGIPAAQFKDKKISTSNWQAKTLSALQVLYAAFDVVSLYKCMPNFKPAKGKVKNTL